MFVLFLNEDGGSVKINERTKIANFEVVIDVAVAVWCMEVFKNMIEARAKQKIIKKFRSSNYVILAESYENSRGIFMGIAKILNGILKNIVVTCGRHLLEYSP